MSNNLNRMIIAIGAIVLAIMIALVLSFAINKSTVSNLEKEANEYMQEEDYNSASTIYSKLVSKTGEKKYKKKQEEVELIIKGSRQYELGMSKIEKKEYISAIKYFKKVDEKDKVFYEKAQKQLEIVENKILLEVEEAIQDDNTYLASSILNDYISIVENSQKAQELLDSLNGTAVEEDDDKEEYDELVSELPENPKDWVGKTFEIKTGKANIREEAKLDSEVITTIAKGGTIVVEKIKYDGDRIWCYGTIKSAKTGETFKAWLSSKNL
ncbi:SH3 domain-containing protein [Miniphocaeibacter massiliensis]|uniref:SH3 domain-containing protein n=1 Tax=Miniphocaeibacter massiliensis TaxID=2041841 RepID=UPI00101AD2E3|nr:SH3 domain-containing protein [Miniphocaeibacter massiliensis]